MSRLSMKNFVLPTAAGAVSAVLHYLYKAGSIPMTRLIDALFTGCLLPFILAIYFYKTKKEEHSWKEPMITGILFFALSMILTVAYMFQ